MADLYVRHPDIPQEDDVEPALVSQEAYDEVWEGRGWVVVEWSPPPEPEIVPEIVEGGEA